MQAWWAEENSLKNIKNLTVEFFLTGSVYIKMMYIYLFYIYIFFKVLFLVVVFSLLNLIYWKVDDCFHLPFLPWVWFPGNTHANKRIL